ncbi:hypothetical protein BpHYR1_022130 [Brachionus plicatilis]|uniref:Uncharacterized protein n=1 Tax=Brachionus plicatilis TaxID=10195 RepID=A0A3M7SES7_BRAPC|nr:hypothetical protein BpHYR1_022130 [Brachionus plicatilis]
MSKFRFFLDIFYYILRKISKNNIVTPLYNKPFFHPELKKEILAARYCPGFFQLKKNIKVKTALIKLAQFDIAEKKEICYSHHD